MLDDVPMATPLALAGVAVALIGYLNGDLTLFQAVIAAGGGGLGAGALGHARNGSGRGVRR